MNKTQSKKVEVLSKIKLPQDARNLLNKIEKALASNNADAKEKANTALDNLYNKVKQIAAKQQTEDKGQKVSEKTVVPKSSDIDEPAQKEEIVEVVNKVADPLQDAIESDPALKGFNRKATDVLRDAARPAMTSGRRVSRKGWKNQYGESKGGRVYYESRENRMDRKAPITRTTKMPWLEDGGHLDGMDFEVVEIMDGNEKIVLANQTLSDAKVYAMVKRHMGSECDYMVRDGNGMVYYSSNPNMFAKGGYMADGGKTTVVDEFGSMSFREQKDDYEMIVISKEAEKDGGRIHKDRFLVFAKDIKEAKQIAEDLWRENFGDTDLSIVKVMSDEAYRFNKMNGIDSYAKGGEVDASYSVWVRKGASDDEEVVKSNLTKAQAKKLMDSLWDKGEYYEIGMSSSLYENGGYMAKGGTLKVIKDSDKNQGRLHYERFEEAIGSFAWIIEGKYNEGILYPLDEFDRKYYSHLKLKEGEMLFRYKTERTMIGMGFPLIKINLDKMLVYFLENSDDDKNPTFNSRGTKLDYLVIEEAFYNVREFAKGGNLSQGDINKKVRQNIEQYLDDASNNGERLYVLREIFKEALIDANFGEFQDEVDEIFKGATKFVIAKDEDETEQLLHDVGQEVANACGWDRYKIADAIEYTCSMNGFSRLAPKIKDIYDSTPQKLDYIPKNEIENVTVIYKGKRYAISSNDIITGAYKFAKGGLSDSHIYIPKRDVVKVTTKDGKSITSQLNGVWVKKEYFESEKPSSDYVVISEKGAYTYIMSKPTNKQDAEKILKDTTIPRGEVGKVITVEDAKARKKVIGRKYLTQSAKKGIVVTSIKDIPNFQERLDEGKITYRGLGLGKLYNDFYDVAGESGYRIKVDGKEYYITETEFNSFSRGADGKLKVKFDAPYRKFESGGVLGQSDFDSLKKGDKISITFSSPIKRENEAQLMVKSKTLVNKGKRNEKEKITFVNLANPSGVKFYGYKDTDDNYIGFAIGDLAIYNVKKVSKMEEGGTLEDSTYLARMAEEYAEREYGKKAKPTSTTMKASKLPNGKNYYTEITVVFTDGSEKTFEQKDFEEFFDVDDYAKGGELSMGIKTEMEEHGMSKAEATKTAKDHLRENPKYYSKMKAAGLEHGGSVEFFDYSNADLEKLPYKLDKYFTKPAGTVRIPLDKIKPIRAREKGVKNANKFMRDAYDGKMEKREPITVYKSAKKGHYILKDGNSTYANAKFSGWKDIYAVVVKNEKLSTSASKTSANSVLTLAKKIRTEGEKWQDAIQRAKKMRNESTN